MVTRRTLLKAGALAIGGAPFIVRAAPAPSPNLALTTYSGADRTQKIIEAAKKEGQVNFYCTIASTDVAPLITPFEKKYGIKVNVWRSGDEQVVQRCVSEAHAGRYTPDAVHVGSSFLDSLYRENLLTPVVSPVQKELLDGSVSKDGTWTATIRSVWVQLYNTQVIPTAQLPKTYEDLLDPRFKGKLGIEAKSADWFATVCQQMGEQKGIAFFTELVKRNGVAARQGNSVVANAVVSGDLGMTLEIYNYLAQHAKRRGGPVDWFMLQPAAARTNGVAVFSHAPHPAAGILLYDYLLSMDAQKIYASMDYVPTHKDIQSPFSGLKTTLADPSMSLANITKWNGLFNHLFLGTNGQV